MARPMIVRPQPRLALLALAASLAGPALAQEREALKLERSVNLQQTFTDNGNLSDNDRHAESITEVSPGFRLSGRSGRVQGSLDYRLDLVQYARDSSRSTAHHQLSADGAAELVDRHVFLDASASISQQSISAFGVQSGGTGLDNNNSTDVASVAVSPSAKARLAGLIDLSAVANWRITRAKDSTAGDSTDWDTTLRAGAQHGIFGWSVSATRQTSDFAASDSYISDSVVGTVSVSLTPRLQVFANHGEDRSDILGNGTQKSSSNGWGFNWSPDVRTQVSGQADRHFYGNSHSFSLSHRFRRALVAYTDSRGVSGQNTESLGPLRQRYLRLYSGCMAVVNNATTCEQLTRALLGFDPQVSLGFLNSAPSLQRTQALVMSITGSRNTFALAASRNQSERLGEQQYDVGDLAIVPSVRQYALTADWSHRLTPQSSLALTASWQKTPDEDTQPGNDLRRVQLSLTSTLGQRTSGTLSVRHVWFDSETSPYRESAIIGSLNYRF